MRPQPGRIHTAGRIGRDDVGDQTPVTGRVLTGDDGHLPDLLMGGEYGFDLAGLDPETADLDLLVGASQVLQLAVPVPAGHIPGPVHPLTRSAAERAGHEPLRRQPRTPQIPPRQTRTRQIQLTRDTHRHRPQPLVQDVDLGVRTAGGRSARSPPRAGPRHAPSAASSTRWSRSARTGWSTGPRARSETFRHCGADSASPPASRLPHPAQHLDVPVQHARGTTPAWQRQDASPRLSQRMNLRQLTADNAPPKRATTSTAPLQQRPAQLRTWPRRRTPTRTAARHRPSPADTADSPHPRQSSPPPRACTATPLGRPVEPEV